MSREVDVFIHFLFLIGAILCWLLNRRKRNLRYIDYCGLFLLVTFVIDGIAAFIMLTSSLESNLFLYHILTPIQLSLILMMYNNVIKNPAYKRIVLWLIPLFVIISMSISFIISFTDTLNTYSSLIKYVIVIMSTLLYFFELMMITPYSKIYYQPIFWISVGLLFHSSVSILFEGLSNYLRTYSESNYGIMATLSSLSNYCLFFFMGIGFIIPNAKSVTNEQ